MNGPGKKPDKLRKNEESRIPKVKKADIRNKRPELLKPEIFSQFSPHVQIEINKLLDQEKVISEKLKDSKNKELFLKSPKAFFEKNHIELSPFLNRKLKDFDPGQFIPSEEYIMPNGQRIVPNIKITIKS